MHASIIASALRPLRLSALGLAALATTSCGAVATSAPAGGDANAPSGLAVAAPDASTREAGTAASASCTGSTPRLFVNGDEVPVLEARGKAVVMNCCDAGELIITAGTFAAPVFFSWRVAATTNGHLDFSGATAAGAELAVGCDPLSTDCAKLGAERFTSGFTGTIDFAATSTGQTASYCVSVTEATGAPNTRFHAMTLYAPKVYATF